MATAGHAPKVSTDDAPNSDRESSSLKLMLDAIDQLDEQAVAFFDKVSVPLAAPHRLVCARAAPPCAAPAPAAAPRPQVARERCCCKRCPRAR